MLEFAGFAGFTNWDAFYHSPLQSWWLLWAAPMAFLVYRGIRGPLGPALSDRGR